MSKIKFECTKQRYHTEKEAIDAGRRTSRYGMPTGWRWTTYRCDQCRFDSGKRAWHWGHNRPKRQK